MKKNLINTHFTDDSDPFLPDLVPILSRDAVYACDSEYKTFLIQVDLDHYDGFFL